MSLFDLKTGERVASALERIADVLELAVPKPRIPSGKPAEDQIITGGDEALWEMEQKEKEPKEPEEALS